MGSEKSLTNSNGINRDLLRPIFKTGRKFYVILGLLSMAMAWALFCWGYQIYYGLGVAGISRPSYWGIYIVNFVFWIGISHAGTLISAILRVTGAEWRRPITRCAEAITVFALMIGPMFIIIDLGRSWLFYYIVPYPSERGLWPNFRSPLLWDFTCINSYLLGSITYLYLPMIPDLALLRDTLRARTVEPETEGQNSKLNSLRRKFYTLLALGWRGTDKQWHTLEKAISVMAVIIMPLAVSVHTVVSWVFAMTLNPMWHSTIFGPYFVIGAIYSGIAAVIIAMWVIRKAFHLEQYMKAIHFNNLGLLLLTLSLLWSYFTFAEYLTVWYGNVPDEMSVLWYKVTGPLAPLFWAMIGCCVVIPLPILAWRRTRTINGSLLASISVIIGMWLERYTIIVGTLTHPRLSFNWGQYKPTWVELSLLLGGFTYFVFLFFAFAKIFPIVSIWEVKEGARADLSATVPIAGTAS